MPLTELGLVAGAGVPDSITRLRTGGREDRNTGPGNGSFLICPQPASAEPRSPARVQRSGSRGDVNIADNCFVDNTLFQLCAPRGAEPHAEIFTAGAASYYTFVLSISLILFCLIND